MYPQNCSSIFCLQTPLFSTDFAEPVQRENYHWYQSFLPITTITFKNFPRTLRAVLVQQGESLIVQRVKCFRVILPHLLPERGARKCKPVVANPWMRLRFQGYSLCFKASNPSSSAAMKHCACRCSFLRLAVSLFGAIYIDKRPVMLHSEPSQNRSFPCLGCTDLLQCRHVHLSTIWLHCRRHWGGFSPRWQRADLAWW